ncbi:MAG: methionyl-tRNA formyltransferase [bacterium]
MRIIFMGTSDFSVISLERLYKSQDLEISAVVTQADKPRGRGQKLQPTPVKRKAVDLGIKVLQSKNVNQTAFLQELEDMDPDFIVVVAFGQKLSKELLEIPEYGCINLHASLLPEYRGAAPIHQAIIDGREYTGVTTMYMAEGWDTGDMIYKEKVKINPEDTVGILHDKLAEIGADLLVKTLRDIEKGIAPRVEQDHDQASYASKINKSTGEVDWNMKSEDIYNLVRGVNPWPGAYTYLDGDLLKIWKVSINTVDTDKDDNKIGQIEPGRVVKADSEDGLIVKTSDGLVEIEVLQMAGRKSMSAKDFLHGYTIDKGTVMG